MEQTTVGQQPQGHMPPAATAPGQPLEADVQAHLGRQLRAVYDDMASQPVPDRFIQLLDALERQGARKPAPEPAKATSTQASTKVGGA